MHASQQPSSGQQDFWSPERRGAFFRRAGWTALWTANVALVAFTLRNLAVSGGGDWRIFVEAGRRVMDGGLFDWGPDYAWTYSPLLAYVFTVIAPIGFLGWSTAHFAVLAGLPNWRLAAIAIVSWPFWADLYNGNTITFVFVAAAAALSGSNVATGLYLAMSLLMPRPLMLPMTMWIVWRRPRWRIPFAAMVVVNLVLVFWTGYGTAWVKRLHGLQEVVAGISSDPNSGISLTFWWSVWLGAAWPAIALVATIVLVLRQRMGWASLTASPYWLPQYLLMILLERVSRGEGKR